MTSQAWYAPVSEKVGRSPRYFVHASRAKLDVRLVLRAARGKSPSRPRLRSSRPACRGRGFDTFDIAARDLPPDRDFTIFLLQQAGSPFGAAEYIGDVSTDAFGNGHAKLRLIVEEAFSSTLVNGSRQRVDPNRIGVWFADPLADDFCVGVNSAVTPFDGDNAAGVQVFNSANADPLPAP
jgi:hypothetical protein